MKRVDVTLSNDLIFELQTKLSMFGGSMSFPATTKAFGMSSKLIQKTWQGWAMGNSVKGAADIKNPSPKLASSIRINKQGDFSAIIETGSQYMERIQNGTPSFDMKEKYPYGEKSRVSKDKVPYLIIPFRWGTPSNDKSSEKSERAHFGNTIPLVVYKLLQSRDFKKSRQEDTIHLEPNYNGENVARHEYSWGDRLDDAELGNVSGIVKMAAGRKSTYFTFRVISANSPPGTWIRQAVAANDVVSAIEQSLRSDIENIIQKGLEEDMSFD